MKLSDLKAKMEGRSKKVAPQGDPIVRISNSFCEISNFPQDAEEALKDALTYENEAAQLEMQRVWNLMRMAKARGQDGFLKKLGYQLKLAKESAEVCWLKDCKFPTGHLDIAKKVLEPYEITYIDSRKVPKSKEVFRFRNKQFTPRYYQQEMIDLAIEHKRGVFESAVGSGKTNVICHIIQKLSVPTLVVVPSRPLLEQTKIALEDAFGSGMVQEISTAKVKSGAKLREIRITTIQTLAALQKKDILDRVVDDLGMICVDETHHSGSKSYVDLLPKIDHIYYRFGFTGTFMRNDSRTLDMWGFLSKKLYHYPASQAIKDGFLTPLSYKIMQLEGTKKRDYHKEYEANYCAKSQLVGGILRILEEIPDDDQILILVDRKEKAGDILHKYLNEKGFDNTYISGDNDKKFIQKAIEDFNEEKIGILIGSTVVGEGVDIRSTKHLILATGGKSEIKIVQALGRAVRLHPGKDKSYVYDFDFEGTKFLSKHAKARLGIFNKQFSGEVEHV